MIYEGLFTQGSNKNKLEANALNKIKDWYEIHFDGIFRSDSTDYITKNDDCSMSIYFKIRTLHWHLQQHWFGVCLHHTNYKYNTKM